LKTDLQVNREIFAGMEYFSDEQRMDELADFFQFDTRRVLFGNGALSQLGAECARLDAHRVVLVRDPDIKPLETAVAEVLRQAGIELVDVYTDIVPNPTIESVARFAAYANGVACDAFIALGGGSTMDTAKTGLCVATAGGSVTDYFGFELFPAPPRWPLIGIPTTAGTGAEVSRGAVFVGKDGKKGVMSEKQWPRVAIVDPQLSASMPQLLTAVTGLDAIGHALECTASKKSTPVGDAVAREALKTGCPHFERAVERGASDPEARHQMARCSLLAGFLLSHINTGAGHALGYGIENVSKEKGSPVPHGAAVAMLLPGVMRHNLPQVVEKYYYAAGVAGLDLSGKSREDGARMMAKWVDDLRRKHTPFGSLVAAGLESEDIPRMVEIGMSVDRLLDQNPVELETENAVAIYGEILN
jgi:alcohol dehydrogenase class IV